MCMSVCGGAGYGDFVEVRLQSFRGAFVLRSAQSRRQLNLDGCGMCAYICGGACGEDEKERSWPV